MQLYDAYDLAVAGQHKSKADQEAYAELQTQRPDLIDHIECGKITFEDALAQNRAAIYQNRSKT